MSRQSEQVACKAAWRAIRKCRINEDANSETNIFAKDKLRDYLTKDQIRLTLDCVCSDCEQDRDGCSTKAMDYLDAIVKEGVGGAIALFGLLVRIRHPQLIANFLRKNWNDQTFIASLTRAHASPTRQDDFSTELLEQDYWPTLRRTSPDDSNELAHSFQREMYAFAIPTIDSDQFYEFHPKTRLPFVNEKELTRKGSSATVFSFEIAFCYRSATFAPGVQLFARKEITDADTRSSYQERDNLNRVKELKDPHIIEMLKAYKHGEAFNIIFPCYATDLDTKLRDRRADGGSRHSIGHRSEWRQFLGVLKAIRNIGQSKTAAKSSANLDIPGKPVMRGFHFDLKPANILISSNDQWVVTDFGQAYFATSGGKTTKIKGQGGTEAYAPPEHDDFNASLSGKYDVWSLGCILLEIMAFAVGGSAAVKELDKLLIIEDQNGSKTSYWQYERVNGTGRQQRPILKHVVADFMEEKINTLTLPVGRSFVKELWDIASTMLEPEVEKRKRIQDVVILFEDLLKTYETAQRSSTQVAASSARPQNSLLIGRKYTYYSFLSSDDNYATRRVAMNAFLHDASDLGVELRAVGDKETLRLDRHATMFVPVYGYHREQNTDPFFDAHFYFSRISLAMPTFRNCDVFAVEERQSKPGIWPDAFKAQQASTGQNVIFSGRLNSFRYRENGLNITDLSTKFISKLSMMSSNKAEAVLGAKAEASGERFASTVALWRYDPAAQAGASASALPVYRLVIFSDRSLYTFKIINTWTIDRRATSEKRIVFTPPDRSSAVSFSGSILRPPETSNASASGSSLKHDSPMDGRSSESSGSNRIQAYAGIPLDPQDLIEIENQHRLKVKELTLTFDEDKDAQHFHEQYLKVREILSKEKSNYMTHK